MPATKKHTINNDNHRVLILLSFIFLSHPPILYKGRSEDRPCFILYLCFLLCLYFPEYLYFLSNLLLCAPAADFIKFGSFFLCIRTAHHIPCSIVFRQVHLFHLLNRSSIIGILRIANFSARAVIAGYFVSPCSSSDLSFRISDGTIASLHLFFTRSFRSALS